MTAPARLALIAQKNSKSLSIQRKHECLGLHCVWPWIEGSRAAVNVEKVWYTKILIGNSRTCFCPQIPVMPIFACLATCTWTDTLVTWGTPRPGAPRGRLAACRAFGLGCRSQGWSSCRWRAEFGDLAGKGRRGCNYLHDPVHYKSHSRIWSHDIRSFMAMSSNVFHLV